jgi:short-subunit dehydrogenase
MTAPSMNETTAIVFGGSSGLGLTIASELAKRGVRLLIVGRDQERLAKAVQLIEPFAQHVVEVLAFDVVRGDTEALRKELDRRFRSVHLIVNAVGRSDRGQLLQIGDEELVDLFRDNVLSMLHGVSASRQLLANARGCVVNIGSLASLFAASGLGGYAVAKFGLAAATQQLRLELSADGIHCLLVCPGPIADGRTTSRYAELAEKRGLSEEATQPGGGAKVRGLDGARLASEIISVAMARRKTLLVRPRKARLLLTVMGVSQRVGEWLLGKFSG